MGDICSDNTKEDPFDIEILICRSLPALALPKLSAAAEEEETSGGALLSKCPKSLHALWNEYEFGLANYKAAKDFSPSERGKVKHVYARRNVLWQKVSEMIRSGWSAHDACNKIYDVYGANQTITSITNQMKKDRRNGGHPALRVVQR